MTPLVRRLNIVASTALALLGAGAVYGANEYSILDEDGRIAAGFLPALCGLVLLVLATIDVIHQVTRKPEMETLADEVFESISEDTPLTTDRIATVPEIDIYGRDQKTRNRQLLIVIVALIVAVALIPLIGMALALALLMIFVSIFVERRRVFSTLVITAVTIAVFYLIFVVFLGVPLPRGLLGLI